MKNETSDRATWKQMFLFTKDGKLQSMDLMYSFFLGIAELFLYFLIANRLTILIEDVFPAMARSGKNWLGILIPAVLCALIAGLIFRIIRKKKIVLMSCWFGVMLIAVILVILLFELDHETLEALIPAYIGIFMIPGGGKQRIPWKKIVNNPSLYAIVVALAVFFLRVRFPAPVAEIVDYLGQMVVPLSMILIGTALGRMSLREVFGNGLSYAVCAVKLLITPVLLFFILRLFIRDELVLGLLTVIAAMPSASISPILSAEYGGDSAFASQSVFLTTLLSLATIPIMVALLLR